MINKTHTYTHTHTHTQYTNQSFTPMHKSPHTWTPIFHTSMGRCMDGNKFLHSNEMLSLKYHIFKLISDNKTILGQSTYSHLPFIIDSTGDTHLMIIFYRWLWQIMDTQAK